MSGINDSSTRNQRSDPTDSPPPIPGHQLLRRIAHGSYGEIWLARTELGAFRAVKIIRRANFTDARPYDREFAGIRRYEPVSREHEGLVDVLQVGQEQAAGFFYYVMELADDAAGSASNPKSEGKTPKAKCAAEPPPGNQQAAIGDWQSYAPLTLAEVIRRRGRLPASEVVEIGIELAQALDFLHSRRLVHRDIKPSNIIFVAGQPKLADVGLVADLGNPQSLVGTEGYIPPEGPGSAKADIYSLGKVLYEAATGKDRQQFPDLPTRLGESHEDPALAELNEVLIKACESRPRARYSSGAQMAADLRRLKAGQSLRARRARRRRRRSIATGAAAIAGLVLAGISLVALVQSYRSRPRLLLCDHFDTPQLNTNLWACGHADYGRPGTGRRSFQIEQSGGELVLLAKAEHTGGWTAIKNVWADLDRDLRQLAPCRIEIEIAAKRHEQAGFILAISDTNTPPRESDPCGVRLAEVNGKVSIESFKLPTTRLRIDLLPTCQAAVVYPDANHLDEFDVVDLQALSGWRLRLLCWAVTSSGVQTGEADFRIREVQVFSSPKGDGVAGRVVAQLSEWPVADAVVKDSLGRTLTKTGTNGAFVVPRSRATRSLTVERDRYSASDGQTGVATATNRLMTVRLQKLTPEFGDVVDVINYGDLDARSIGFMGDNLTLLVHDSNTTCRLLPVELRPSRVVPAVSGGLNLEFPPDHQINDFVECGSRLTGITWWPVTLLTLHSAPPSLLLEPKHPRDGNRLNWACGAAFDGSVLWLLESDTPNRRFGLHALDLDRRAAIKFLSSTDEQMQGLAWDGRSFWISNAKGRVYAIDRDMAVNGGTVQAGIGREFRGNYDRLAFGRGCLWGLERQRHRICKIKTTD